MAARASFEFVEFLGRCPSCRRQGSALCFPPDYPTDKDCPICSDGISSTWDDDRPGDRGGKCCFCQSWYHLDCINALNAFVLQSEDTTRIEVTTDEAPGSLLTLGSSLTLDDDDDDFNVNDEPRIAYTRVHSVEPPFYHDDRRVQWRKIRDYGWMLFVEGTHETSHTRLKPAPPNVMSALEPWWENEGCRWMMSHAYLFRGVAAAFNRPRIAYTMVHSSEHPFIHDDSFVQWRNIRCLGWMLFVVGTNETSQTRREPPSPISMQGFALRWDEIGCRWMTMH